MRMFGTLILIAAALVPGQALAQQWSPQQQEVLEHIQACWDAWTTKDFNRWVNTCRPADGFTYWGTGQGSPNGLDYWRKIATPPSSTNIEYVWTEKRPLTIQIDRDIAIVYFYALWSTVNSGQPAVSEQKRMEVFRKVDGRWTLLGGMLVPMPR